LREVAYVGGDILGETDAQGSAEEPLLVRFQSSDGGEVGYPHAPISGAEQRRNQVPGHEAPSAGHHAPPQPVEATVAGRQFHLTN
jgi:hypothetical protein